jgi:hypothetical protein
MKIFPLILLLLLVGCAGQTVKEPTEVKVPVYVPCQVIVPDTPTFEVDKLNINADIWDMMIALRVERQQRKQFELELSNLLNDCVKDAK